MAKVFSFNQEEVNYIINLLKPFSGQIKGVEKLKIKIPNKMTSLSNYERLLIIRLITEFEDVESDIAKKIIKEVSVNSRK